MTKLSSLTPEQKTRLLAEVGNIRYDRVDGWKLYETVPQRGSPDDLEEIIADFTSYDAIIPCLTRLKLWNTIMQRFQFATPSPEQICDEVLVETGKCER